MTARFRATHAHDCGSHTARQWYREWLTGDFREPIQTQRFGAAEVAGQGVVESDQQAEAAERRRLDLAEQSSRLKTAEERIKIWERIHEVALPRDAAHNLVDIIAANTGLTEADVRDEQQRRAALKAAAAAASA